MTQKFKTVAFVCVLLILLFICFLYIPSYYYDVSDLIFKDDNKEDIYKKNVLLFIGIFSSHTYKDRRDALRITWCGLCTEQECAYKFILDGLGLDKRPLNTPMMNKVRRELVNKNDMVLLETPVGLNFALRFYKSLKYAMKNFNFKYFLRLDDDQYLCMHKLMYELSSRPRQSLFWGYVHCAPIARIDESFILITEDLVVKILNDDSVLCSPFGTEAVSSWIYNLMESGTKITWFTDNKRIFHSPPIQRSNRLYEVNICRTYISLHGIWNKNIMTPLHQRVLDESAKEYEIPTVYHLCPKKGYRISLEELDKHDKAQSCKDTPVFTFNKGKPYIGREVETT